jgi:ubiquinone/menaquinone biosynthesis C-methylase UbiE
MKYNPPLYFHFLTPVYDSLFRLLLPSEKIRKTSIQLLDYDIPTDIVELGSGTGALTLPLAKQFPSCRISAVDIDRKSNAILHKKIWKNSIGNVQVQEALSYHLPFETGSVSVVFASLLFCNLPLKLKYDTMQEAKRVLHKNGKLLITEWGPPLTLLSKTGFMVLKAIGRNNITDLSNGMLPNYLKANGFTCSQKQTLNTLFGTLYFYQAEKLT